jgi:hypothetical protein
MKFPLDGSSRGACGSLESFTAFKTLPQFVFVQTFAWAWIWVLEIDFTLSDEVQSSLLSYLLGRGSVDATRQRYLSR